MEKGESQGDLTKVTPPAELKGPDLEAVFQHVIRRLAAHRNHAEMYAQNELALSSDGGPQSQQVQQAQAFELNSWAQTFLENAWAACQEPGGRFQLRLPARLHC